VPITASGLAGVAGAGTLSLAVAVPNEPALVGLEVDTQLVMFDPGAPRRLAASAGRAFWICP
jgi:hypothetical protein